MHYLQAKYVCLAPRVICHDGECPPRSLYTAHSIKYFCLAFFQLYSVKHNAMSQDIFTLKVSD